jgi:hypothetical protein
MLKVVVPIEAIFVQAHDVERTLSEGGLYMYVQLHNSR